MIFLPKLTKNMSNLCPWDPPRASDTDLQNFWRGGRLEFSTSHQNFACLVSRNSIQCQTKIVERYWSGSNIKLMIPKLTVCKFQWVTITLFGLQQFNRMPKKISLPLGMDGESTKSGCLKFSVTRAFFAFAVPHSFPILVLIFICATVEAPNSNGQSVGRSDLN